MKRYFLFVLLFGIVFLGLGNGYTSAVCETQKTNHSSLVWTSHTFTCQYSGADAPAVCNEYGQTCFPDTTCNASLGLECCVCNKPPATTPTPPSDNASCAAAGKGIWNSTTNTCCEVGHDIENGQCVSATCEQDDPDCQENPTVVGNGGGSNGSAGTTSSDGLTDAKCSAAYDATTNPQGLGEGGKLNASGLGCTCKDGYKKIDHACVPCNTKGVCCGIELNTNVPFIGRCIEGSTNDVGDDEQAVTSEDAFPVLMGSLTQILVTIILIVSFVLIIVGGIMISTGNPSGGKSLIIKVVIGIALLGASGVILRLINPNFFG